MATSIRLARGGAKKRPYYKIVVADTRSPRDGRFIERIGSYNPLLAKEDEKRVVIDVERAKHWVSLGAQPTDRVARFLDAAGVRQRTDRNNPVKGEPGAKSKDRAAERIAAENAPSDIEETVTAAVYLDLQNEQELEKLAKSVERFLAFLGYAPEKESVSAI